MNNEQYKKWKEYMLLIAKYDWAVEDMPDPYETGLSREVAKQIREELVEQAGKVVI